MCPNRYTCCTHMFGWVLHNPYAHDATHSSYSRSYFCPHALFLSPSLCVHARAHRTSFCPWLDAEGCLLLCQINHQTLVAGPNPPDSQAILPVEAYILQSFHYKLIGTLAVQICNAFIFRACMIVFHRYVSTRPYHSFETIGFILRRLCTAFP